MPQKNSRIGIFTAFAMRSKASMEIIFLPVPLPQGILDSNPPVRPVFHGRESCCGNDKSFEGLIFSNILPPNHYDPAWNTDFLVKIFSSIRTFIRGIRCENLSTYD